MEVSDKRKATIENLRPLVEAETGMDFSGNRFSRLLEAVEKAEAVVGSDDLDRVLATPHERGPFLERLNAELTVGETFFFRNEHHYESLREQVIPEILRENADRGEVRIWSAGCATGEEPYSLAILMDQILGAEHKDDDDAWQVSILATDINTDFLQRARNAEYRSWSFRRTTVHQDGRYFTKSGDKYCLRSALRDRVRFVYLNLVKDVYPSPLTGTVGLDLIVFRNVAIYLRPEVIAAIVKQFSLCLRPGGWLLLGEAEVLQVESLGYHVQRIGQATFFQKPGIGDSLPSSEVRPRPVLPELGVRPPAVAAGQAAKESESVPEQETSGSGRTVAPPQFDWEQVEQSLQREDFEAAERAFDLIRDRNQRAKMKMRFVRRLLDLSQTTRAREILDACLDEDPLLIDGHLLKGSLAEERGDLIEAETSCRRALYLDRNCIMAHFHLALVQQQTGDASGARKSLQLVHELGKRQDTNALVEHGDGVCYGRLSELARSMIGS